MIDALRRHLTPILVAGGILLWFAMVLTLVVGAIVAFRSDASVTAWTMIWTAVYAAFTIFMAGVLLAAGVAAAWQLRSMERARQGQLLTELSRRWEEPLLWESRQKANRFERNPAGLHQALIKLERRNHRDYYALVRLPNFFEDLGILVAEGIISPKLVKKSREQQIKYYWDLYQCYIRAQQKIKSTTFENFGKLVDSVGS